MACFPSTAREGAQRLWSHRALGVKLAVARLQKKHMAALLVLTSTPNIKGDEPNLVLSSALEAKLVDSAGALGGASVSKMQQLVSLFIDTAAVPIPVCGTVIGVL